MQQRRTLVADPLEICHIDSFRGNSEGDARTCPRRYPRVRGDRAAADHAGRRRDAAGLPWTGHAPERCKPGALRSDVKFWPRIMTIAAGVSLPGSRPNDKCESGIQKLHVASRRSNSDMVDQRGFVPARGERQASRRVPEDPQV